jgi:hypothetical protein
MVNARFPKPAPYGFETVDAAIDRKAKRRQWKIDAPNNRSIFWQMFGELS